MFSSGAGGGGGRSTQPSGNSPSAAGQSSTSALMAANMKMKRKTQTSPKAPGAAQHEQVGMKPVGAMQGASLKQYAAAAQSSSQSGFPEKYSTKTRN